MGVLISLILMSISCHLIWRSANGFEIASDFLGRNLFRGIKGATINAIASSMPELLTTLFFLFYLKDVDGFSGALGITAGSAIFNGMIIPALVVLTVISYKKTTKIKISKKVILRDGLVLLITICVLIFFISGTTLHWWHGLILMTLYLLYLGYILIIIKKKKGSGESVPVMRQYSQSEYKLFRKIFLIKTEELFIGKREINRKRAWLLLIFSTIIMALGSFLLVQASAWFGSKEFNISLFGDIMFKGVNMPILFVAVILAAAASSIPDTVISVKDAKKGNYDDAISNALGSNTFDISFALGFPLFLYTLFENPIMMSQEINSSSTVLWVILLIITVIALVIFLVGKYLNKFKAGLLLVLYILFIFFIIGEVYGSEIVDKISVWIIEFVM